MLDAEFGDDDVRDAMIITQYQRMVHYALAGYGCCHAFAHRLGLEADARLQAFQTDIAREAGVFHNLITLPTFHGTAKVMNDLSEGYFGDQKMLAYVKNIQREEIRTNVSAVKHQHEVGSNLGDDFKEMTGGERALKAGGEHNTMNQFENAA